MKKTKYLKYYNKWAKQGESGYLCHTFEPESYETREGKNDPLFELFTPTKEEIEIHVNEGYSDFAWGCHKDDPYGYRLGIGCYFSNLRQNVVLLMAAMNNEL